MRADHLWFFGYKQRHWVIWSKRDISENTWKVYRNKGNVKIPGWGKTETRETHRPSAFQGHQSQFAWKSADLYQLYWHSCSKLLFFTLECVFVYKLHCHLKGLNSLLSLLTDRWSCASSHFEIWFCSLCPRLSLVVRYQF